MGVHSVELESEEALVRKVYNQGMSVDAQKEKSAFLEVDRMLGEEIAGLRGLKERIEAAVEAEDKPPSSQGGK